MRRFLSLVYVLVVAVAWAAGSRAPLPKALEEAKTAYVQNDSWHSSTADQCSDELSKWGRFKLVGDRKEADLVFHITGSIEDRTTRVVTDARTEQRQWSSRPDKATKTVDELRKRMMEQPRQAPQ
jgi:hypothetical protein